MPSMTPVNIWPTVTTIEYPTSTMFQRHIFQTPAGVLAAVIQNGSVSPPSGTAGLVLMRYVNGAWSFIAQISVGTFATASGVITDNNDIYLVYSTIDDVVGAAKDIFFRKLTYISATQTWSVGDEITIYDSDASHAGSTSVIERDSNGILWCGFRLFDSVDYEIRMYYSETDGLTWNDTGLTFGSKNNSSKKVPELIALPMSKQIAMVYHDYDGVTDSKRYAYRNDYDLKAEPWTDSHLTTLSSSAFGNHQSCTVGDDNIVCVYIDERDSGDYIVGMFKPFRQSWQDGVDLGAGGMYPTVTYLGGGIFIAFAGVALGSLFAYISGIKFYVDSGWDFTNIDKYRVSNEIIFDVAALYSSAHASVNNVTLACSNATVNDVKHSITNAMLDIAG
ncbi:MAG: hypothetical protein KAJ19_24905, partial [Gammaproteobacteria bacterium]|nr:hypothetical protein [Gammaproteobacteria bacterium]